MTAVSIWVFQFTLSLTLGTEAKLFDRFPIIQLAYAGYVVIFARFVWAGAKEFKDRGESSLLGEGVHFRKIQKVLWPIFLNMVGLCMSIVTMWAFDLLLHSLFGQEAKILDIKIAHLAHGGDTMAFLGFIAKSFEEFKNV